MSTIRTIRAFVALNIPITMVRRVADLQADLRAKAWTAKIRVGWVPPPNMHVTLKFLGNIPAENATIIGDRFRELLAERPAIRVQLKGMGAFPSREQPRVLWLGTLCENDELVQLATDVDDWLADLRYPKEKRPFHPHLTLGRVKTPRPSLDLLEGLEEREVGRCVATEVVLYESEIQQRGAEYSALAKIPLLEK